jgi:UDP-N-acetylmuramate dehydrogenase
MNFQNLKTFKMEILKNISLKKYNTFGIEVYAKEFVSITSSDLLAGILYEKPIDNFNYLVLGGGSNILFTKDVDALVLSNEILGIEKVMENEDYVFIKAMAGENWHQFVLTCLDNNWNGLENLSLIPGRVGAAPMQNIGAYGVELKDVFWQLEGWHVKEKKLYVFNNSDCEFGYRESVFKSKFKNQFIISSVTFRLNKIANFNIKYGAIEEQLNKMGQQTLTSKAISNAVIAIRQSKLPNPTILGNAGSFFKNPEINATLFNQTKQKFDNLIAYSLSNGNYKIAAGWLIEQCGFKGFKNNNCGVHVNQALVLVNYGNATGNDIYKLSQKIIDAVIDKFNIQLEREVNIY